MCPCLVWIVEAPPFPQCFVCSPKCRGGSGTATTKAEKEDILVGITKHIIIPFLLIISLTTSPNVTLTSCH